MRTAASIGTEDDLGLAIAVEVGAGEGLVEYHTVPGCSEDDFARPVIDRRRAAIFTRGI